MRIDTVLKGIAAAGLLTFLSGCGGDGGAARGEHGAAAHAELPGLFDAADEGFADATLRITSHETRPDGSALVEAAAMHDGVRVGLQLETGRDWSESSLAGGVTVYSGTLTLRSPGAAGDALLRALAAAYQVAPPAAGMRDEITLTAIGMGDDPRELAARIVHMKIFHEPEVQGAPGDPEAAAQRDALYAEVFVNVDLRKQTLEIREKAEDYRAPLIRALSAE